MNKYLSLLKKRAERAYLSARIVLHRPDLIGKSFTAQIRTFAMDEIERLQTAELNLESVADESGRLPFSELACLAMEQEATESKGYYAAEARLYKNLYTEVNHQLYLRIADNGLTTAELIETRTVLKEAIDSLTAIKFSNSRVN